MQINLNTTLHLLTFINNIIYIIIFLINVMIITSIRILRIVLPNWIILVNNRFNKEKLYIYSNYIYIIFIFTSHVKLIIKR